MGCFAKAPVLLYLPIQLRKILRRLAAREGVQPRPHVGGLFVGEAIENAGMSLGGSRRSCWNQAISTPVLGYLLQGFLQGALPLFGSGGKPHAQ